MGRSSNTPIPVKEANTANLKGAIVYGFDDSIGE